jgi:glycosyltransferase involved in cell wall biosynthesis
MRIVYVVTRASPIGGVQVHIRDLTAALQKQGHTPTVLTGGVGPLVEQLRAQGTPTISLRHLILPINPIRDVLAFHEIRSALKRLRPELVAVHSSKAGVLGRMAAKTLGIPALLTAHGWNFTPGIPPMQAGLYRQIERWAGPLASKIITVSEFDRNLAIESGIASAERIVAVHNGMPDVGSHLRADPSRSPPHLIMVARFGAQKDHPTLLRALANLREFPWVLDLVGDGPLLRDMQSLVTELDIAQRVHFWGQRHDVEQFLARAQVMVLTTNWEGFPRSILEAMRAGLPVIASSVGGIAEAVEDQRSGYVVPRGDVSALQERLTRLLREPGLRAQLGTHGRHRYEEHFTLDHCVRKTFEVYHNILNSATEGSQIAPNGKTPRNPVRSPSST